MEDVSLAAFWLALAATALRGGDSMRKTGKTDKKTSVTGD